MFNGRNSDATGVSNAQIISNDTFERMKQNNRRRNIKRRVLYVFIAVVICLVFIISCSSVFFRVKEIMVVGNELYNDSEIIETAGISENMNMYAISSSDIEQVIKLKYPYIKAVSLIRHLPTTLELSVKMDNPLYCFELCDEYFVMSDTMRILECVKDKEILSGRGIKYISVNMPPIRFAFAGREIVFENEPDFEFAQKLLSQISASDLFSEIVSIDFSDKYNVYFNYDGRFKVILGNNSDVETKMIFISSIFSSSFSKEDKGRLDVYDVKTAYAVLE